MLKRGLGLIYTTTKMQKFPNLVTLNSIKIIYFDFGLEPRSCLSTEMHLCKFWKLDNFESLWTVSKRLQAADVAYAIGIIVGTTRITQPVLCPFISIE